MSYSQRLYPWALIRLLPKMQRMVVRRFRNRSDAEGHLQALKRLMPDADFIIIFDLGDPIDGQPIDDQPIDEES
ncbi:MULTISPECIES: hypothetical protein [unclassified Moorena]|uniref:hypothetical protein n=1 Tax=unclassified Moorena TaxID=2683338 RepID=UPI0013B8EF97|nr:MULTISPECIES: hypothetical protein [unclassified Moorena]NEQ17853.1 hypothetical protein [Moorena sp. SIO3E2]NEP30486.1 hypothetical protein [Moorena sp. SIO3B2]NEP66011.1 hypothetical protein [Moorena sp. SIO3A5]NEQ09269.1 hypothetical protein [Moorena sp. SIO4E2]NER86750.1 hypothetical protein [Moorena sp. SIO3A2]